MTDYLDTYCPECDIEVSARLSSQQAVLTVRGEDVAYTETVAVCPRCGAVIGDARLEGGNLTRAYDVYRSRHGIMAPEQIRSLRDSYGLSLREFSKFLGFGEQTAYRYEHGDLPDQTHSTALRTATTAEGARMLLSQSRPKLSARSVVKIEQRIRALEANASGEIQQRLTLEKRMSDAPSAANGYRNLSIDRVCALAFLLAGKCKDLYWTKLQKAAFFADQANFERTGQSLTGLTYAHATYGPVIDRKEEVRFILAEKGVVDFKEQGYGEVLVPLACDDTPFDTDELSVIDDVARFVNTFSSATGLSNYSHHLSCWVDSSDGEIIEFARGACEVSQAIRDRMESAQP